MKHTVQLFFIFMVLLFSMNVSGRPVFPYSTLNPVVYINDQITDNYGSAVALALASDGAISLVGNICGYPKESWMQDAKYKKYKHEYVTAHFKTHRKAIASGFKNLPPPLLGLFDRHKKPASGRIKDTKIIGSPGTDLIVNEAMKCSPEKPLVVVIGGDFCTLADAYLKEPAIAERVVVAARAYNLDSEGNIKPGNKEYNINQSGWSATIVLKKFRVICFPGGSGMSPKGTCDQVKGLPPKPLRKYMIQMEHWHYGNQCKEKWWLGDAPPLLSVVSSVFIKDLRYARISGYVKSPAAPEMVPSITCTTDSSNIMIVMDGTNSLTTKILWEHLANPCAWDPDCSAEVSLPDPLRR